MDISQIKAFIVVAEELNFRKAADRLHISQPPLTRLISKLESELSTQLFLRNTRKVELTGAGVALLKESRDILDHLQRAEKTVRDIGRLKQGQLNVSFSSTAFYSQLPKLVWSYKEQFPQVKISMSEISLSKQIQGLLKGRLDLAFFEGPVKNSGLSSLEVHSENLGVLLPEDHRLAKRKKIHIKDLDGETFILHTHAEMKGFYEDLVQFLEGHKIQFKIRHRKHGESCPFLVATHEGVSLITKGNRRIDTPGTVFVSIEQPPKLAICAVWSSENPSLELKSFLNFVQEQKALHEPSVDCLAGLVSSSV